jgi:hypothetical protein
MSFSTTFPALKKQVLRTKYCVHNDDDVDDNDLYRSNSHRPSQVFEFTQFHKLWHPTGEQDRPCTYDVTLSCVHETIVDVQKQ